MIPLQSYRAWAIILSFFHVAAISSSVFRLYLRYSIRRLWWDDYMAAFALLIDTMYFIVLWIRYKLGNPQHSTEVRVILYWLSSLSFFVIVWSARVSLALSLTRLVQRERKVMRRITSGLAIVFGLIGIALLLQVMIVCGSDSSWHHSVNVQCGGTSWVSALTTDVIADVSLIAMPLVILWRVKLPRRQRQLVTGVFAASILTCLTSIALHTFLLGASKWGPGAGMVVSFMSHIEATIALVVANLLVVVAYLYRVFHLDDASDVTQSNDYDKKTTVPTFVGSTLSKDN